MCVNVREDSKLTEQSSYNTKMGVHAEALGFYWRTQMQSQAAVLGKLISTYVRHSRIVTSNLPVGPL